MLSRKDSLKVLHKYLKNETLLKHSYAVEAILGEIARYLKRDEKLWSLTGLLHDIDYEYTKQEPEKHATIGSEILQEILPEHATNAIKAHNYQYTMQIPQTSLDKALIAADAVSGLIIATALVIPTKKLADVKITTLMKKYDDHSFAAGCNRKRIDLCEDLDIPVEKFLELSLQAMKNISDTLDL
ncbi:MAG: HDIG domain-containing protein [Thermoplasmatota archaeon]